MFFCILHMLNIHTSLRKRNKKNAFDLNLNKINIFGIHEAFIKIAKNVLVFEQYRMSLNQGKHNIEVQNDDSIKRNQILFHFTRQTFNGLDGFYLRERCLLTDVIME